MAEPDYGMYSYAMNDPEVGPLLTRAKNEGWTPDKLEFELRKTSWWRHREDSERQWEALIASNPSEATQRAGNMRDKIEHKAFQLGVRLPEGTIASFADSFLRYSWSDIQLNNAILAWYKYSSVPHAEGALQFGESAATVMELKNLAADYLVPLSDLTIQEWTVSILQGRATMDSFKAYMAQTAAGSNPWMKQQLDAGFTVRAIMDPYLQTAARELGMNPATMDLSDPKWRRMLEFTNEKGERVQPTEQQVVSLVRTDEAYGWDKSTNANEQAANAETALLRMFGKV